MKSIITAIAFALAGVAASTATAKDCTAAASAAWTQVKGYTINASVGGPDCAKAVALIVIRDADGEPVWHESYVAGQVMVLAGAQNGADMTKALGEWIDPSNPQFTTTADLPDWPEGADSPMSGEFAFYPEEGVDRAAWAKMRAAKTPVYCYVQGMESSACVTNDPEMGFYMVGVQTFPG